MTHKNPYRDGTAYAAILDAIRKAGQKGITRQALLEAGHAPADVTVVTSPRAEGESRGDCRGNLSARGHLYYVQVKVDKDGERRFVLRWRKPALEPSQRKATAQKVSARKVKAKGKAKAKAKAKAKRR
jgi:hypothetical protein